MTNRCNFFNEPTSLILTSKKLLFTKKQPFHCLRFQQFQMQISDVQNILTLYKCILILLSVNCEQKKKTDPALYNLRHVCDLCNRLHVAGPFLSRSAQDTETNQQENYRLFGAAIFIYRASGRIDYSTRISRWPTP